MDSAMNTMGEGIESKETIKRTEKEDGSYEEIRVEQVDGGFIKSVSTRSKDGNGDWKYENNKSVHSKNPFDDDDKEESKEKSLAEKLEAFIKND
jgi:hypothetical protein